MTDIFRRLRYNFWEIYDPLHRRGFTDKEIAEELGIHPGTLMRYKKLQLRKDREEQKRKIEEVMKHMKIEAKKGLEKWRR